MRKLIALLAAVAGLAVLLISYTAADIHGLCLGLIIILLAILVGDERRRY